VVDVIDDEQRNLRHRNRYRRGEDRHIRRARPEATAYALLSRGYETGRNRYPIGFA
jgi:hypothetical protein